MGECTLLPTPHPIEPFIRKPPFTRSLSVVVPCLNEEATIAELVEQLASTLDGISSEFEIIVVDDGSRDATPQVLRELAGERPWLKVIQFRRTFGQTAALMAGCRAARGATLIAIDADLQND